MKKKIKKVYKCKHCETPWGEDFLAELCFKVDMDILSKGKPIVKMSKK